MFFGTPLFLLGLLGIGIPLAIHLIRRQRAERIVLPTVRFLKPAPKKLIFFQQIQQWFLLLLRAAIIGLLAIAFARPIFTGAPPELSGATLKSVVILLDTSMSMQYADRFNRGQAAAIDIIRSLETGDEAAVVTFAQGPDRMQPLTTDLKSLEAFVRGIPAPEYRTTNYLTALRAADHLLQTARHPGKTVYLVSDFQESGIPDGYDYWKLSAGIDLDFFDVGGGETSNMAVAGVHLTRQQDNFILVGRVKNFGTVPVDSVHAALAINGIRQATETIDLKGSPEIQVKFPFTLKRTGMHRGTLTISGDRFEPDNMFHFTVNVTPALRILCVSSDPTGGGNTDETYWFRSALSQTASEPVQR